MSVTDVVASNGNAEPYRVAVAVNGQPDRGSLDAAADHTFPELLRSCRERAGLTQRALANLSTISPRAIRDLEAGRAHARAQTVDLLAGGLRLQGPLRELFIRAGLNGRRTGQFGGHLGPAVPRPVNTLVGRDTEVRVMVDVLESGRRRMISISGFPGVGKTRVAAEVAMRLGARLGWPVLWLGPDAPARDGTGTPFGPLLRSLRSLVDSPAGDVSQICQLLGRHEALLVLDGLADARAPSNVEELLAYCPGIRVISTSRAPWQVAGVQAAVISPLDTPASDWDAAHSLDALASVPSVRLLVDRLAEVRPGFTLCHTTAAAAAELCRRVDGLPLAIEAAAGRSRVLSLRQLADVPDPLDFAVPARAGGAPETIGGLIAASLGRLNPSLRAILLELARSDRPWTVPDLAAVVGRPLDEVVDDLGLLVGSGQVHATHSEPATTLHVPNLLRAFLSRTTHIRGVVLSVRPHARSTCLPIHSSKRGGGMAHNSLEALREAGILGGTMRPELEEFYGSLSKEESDVIISVKNRLAAVLPDVVAHSADWTKPDATQEGFDAAMLCACGFWSGSGQK